MNVNGQFSGRAATSLLETVTDVFSKHAELAGRFNVGVSIKTGAGPIDHATALQTIERLKALLANLPAEEMIQLNVGIDFLSDAEERASQELESSFSKKMELLNALSQGQTLAVPGRGK